MSSSCIVCVLCVCALCVCFVCVLCVWVCVVCAFACVFQVFERAWRARFGAPFSPPNCSLPALGGGCNPSDPSNPCFTHRWQQGIRSLRLNAPHSQYNGSAQWRPPPQRTWRSMDYHVKGKLQAPLASMDITALRAFLVGSSLDLYLHLDASAISQVVSIAQQRNNNYGHRADGELSQAE